jgi:tetratricopeptide (TPR) repeat protein
VDDGELERGRLAVEQTSPEDPRRPERMRDLGALWRRRFLASGDVTELDQAIGYFRGALGGAGTAFPAAEYNLAVLLSDRYDARGDVADLAAATEAAQRGLNALPAGSSERHDYLAMLAVCLWERYDATGSLTDLERAIDVAAEAVAGTPPDAPLGPRLHSNLGMMHLDRHERTGDAADLDRAIALAKLAVDAAPPGDPERPGFRNNLANALRLRFELQFGDRGDPLPEDVIDLSDLDAAIQLYRAALSEPGDGPAEVERAMIASNLGDALLDRAAVHELTGERDQADRVYGQALAAHEEAVAATPPTAPDRSGRLNKLAVIQRALADRTSAQADIDAARATFREACQTGLLAAPEMALAAAGNWLAWEVDRKDWRHAVVADGYALRAADVLHRAQQRRADRETWLLESRGLAAEAAYATVRDGDLRAAVARLERARAILLSDNLDLVSAALAGLPDQALARRYADAAQLVRQLQST